MRVFTEGCHLLVFLHDKRGSGALWGVGPLFYKGANPSTHDPVNPSSKVPPPNTIILRIRFQHMNTGETQAFRPEQYLSVVLNFYFPANLWYWASFCVFICLSDLAFYELPVYKFPLVSNGLVYSYWFVGLLPIFWYQSFVIGLQISIFPSWFHILFNLWHLLMNQSS